MDPINWIQNPLMNRDCLDSWITPSLSFPSPRPPYVYISISPSRPHMPRVFPRTPPAWDMGLPVP